MPYLTKIDPDVVPGFLEARALNPTQLARLADVSPGFVHALARMERKSIRASEAVKLARAMDYPLELFAPEIAEEVS